MLRYPRLTVLALLLAAGPAGWYTATHLGINTDTAALLSADLPFRQAQRHYQREFPALVDAFVAVVDGATPEQAEDAANALVAGLAAADDLFARTLVEGSEPYFERNALLYSDLPQLRRIAERLIAGQALVGMLGRDPSLLNLATSLEKILSDAQPQDSAEIDRLLDTLRAGLADPPVTVSWLSLLTADTEVSPPTRRLVLIKPRLDFTVLLPAGPAIGALREVIARVVAASGPGLRIRITGDAALAHEEMAAAMSGAMLAGALAFAAVSGLLLIGLGSVWLVLASLISLMSGLTLTAGFATLAIGQLNLISIAFAMLYIGLAVDYSIHFCLGYREQLGSHRSREDALRATMRELRRPLILCTVTTAIGFFAFLPTSFQGVAELGLIAGTGMFVNLGLTFLLLPSLLLWLPVPRAWQPRAGPSVALRARPVLVAAAALTLAAAVLLPSLQFDRDPLNLRDKKSESVAALRDLIADRSRPILGATVLAGDAIAAHELASQLSSLPEVGEVMTLESLIPGADNEKLALIDDLAILLDLPHANTAARRPAEKQVVLAALQGLVWSAGDYAERRGSAAAQAFADHLAEALQRLHSAGEPFQADAIHRIEQALLATLPRALGRLRAALAPDSEPAATLPDTVRERWISTSGAWRIAVQPRHALADNATLREFVEAVQRVAPTATDEPVLNLRAGDEIVHAFRTAFALAVAAIGVLLAVLLRRARRVFVVLLPLACAGILTSASMVLLGIQLNFANIIALPLLFGIGVDNGVHVLQRWLRDPTFHDSPYKTATARAIVFSGATTLAGFGNLMLSPHPGMASMGMVLSIGVGWTLLVTLVVIPAALVASPKASG